MVVVCVHQESFRRRQVFIGSRRNEDNINNRGRWRRHRLNLRVNIRSDISHAEKTSSTEPNRCLRSRRTSYHCNRCLDCQGGGMRPSLSQFQMVDYLRRCGSSLTAINEKGQTLGDQSIQFEVAAASYATGKIRLRSRYASPKKVNNGRRSTLQYTVSQRLPSVHTKKAPRGSSFLSPPAVRTKLAFACHRSA